MCVKEERALDIGDDDATGVEGEFDVGEVWGDLKWEGVEFDRDFKVLRIKVCDVM